MRRVLPHPQCWSLCVSRLYLLQLLGRAWVTWGNSSSILGLAISTIGDSIVAELTLPGPGCSWLPGQQELDYELRSLPHVAVLEGWALGPPEEQI